MSTARPLAVLFDLWGTLVPSRSERRDEISCLIAADLGVDPQAFVDAVSASHAARFTGESGGLTETLAELARRCGGEPGAEALRRAAERRLELTRELLVADGDTLAVLDALRAAGLKLGLVTDSSIEVPTVWSGCPLSGCLQATAFSCLVGVCKPAPEMYLRVTAALGVAARECVYVGDGDGRELTGAAALGMAGLRLGGGGAEVHYEDDIGFAGPAIERLEELPGHPLLAGASV
jgi:putative hydrolase of the HAD superfamily